MTLHATATGSSKGMGRLLLAATLATTFALGVGAGVALRDATSSDDGSRSTAATLPASSTPGSVEAAPTRGGLTELHTEQQAGAATTRDSRPVPFGRATFFLFDSEEQISEWDLDQAIDLGRVVGIAVVQSPEDEAVARQEIADQNEWRRGMGLPGVTVVDLRGR